MKVIAYQVTAMRGDFRRVGRLFKRGVPTKVDVTALTTAQAEYLAASSPRDLLVEVIREAAPAPRAPIAPPPAPAPIEADGIGTSPSEPAAPKKGRGR